MHDYRTILEFPVQRWKHGNEANCQMKFPSRNALYTQESIQLTITGPMLATMVMTPMYTADA